jgi:hypothetical protein
VVIDDVRVRVGLRRPTCNRETTDDRRDDEPALTRGEDPRRRCAARHDRLRRRAADGDRGRGADRRGAWREERHPPGATQRLSRPRLGDPGRHGRATYPQAAQGQLLPRLPRAAPHGREGADRGHSGSLHPGHLDPFGRRAGQGHGHERRLQEPGQPAVRGDRPARQSLPRPAAPAPSAAPEATGHICGSTRPT